MRKIDSISIGTRFGKWTIIEKIDSQTVKTKCDCGNQSKQKIQMLFSQRSTQCRACSASSRGKTLSEGMKIGQLTLVCSAGELPGKRGGLPVEHWLCQCDCGREVFIPKAALRTTKRPTCSCNTCIRSLDKHHNWNGFGELSGYHWARINRDAKIRNIPVNISIRDAWNLYLEQESRCTLTGVQIFFRNQSVDETTASLDRIDSLKGYEVGNVQWVHKHINQMKLDYTEEYFIKMCRAVAAKANNK